MKSFDEKDFALMPEHAQRLSALREAIAAQHWQQVPEIMETSIADLPDGTRGQLLCAMGNMLRSVDQAVLALPCFLQALALVSEPINQARVHGWLSETLDNLKDFERAKLHGEKAILLRDAANQQQLHLRRIVAFSLYGSNPVYCESAVLNAQLMPDIYPGWDMVVYHDNTVPGHVLQRMAKLNVKLISAEKAQAAHMPGTFWRFLALEEPNCDAVIMRDADSLISEREKVLVEAWLTSDKPFHIIRDDYGQTDLMLAGLWGVRHGLLEGIRKRIDQFLKDTHTLHPTHADQIFLAEHIWPRIKRYSLHHCSVFTLPDAVWPENFPVTHINACGDRQQLGSWYTSIYQVQSPHDYTFFITEGDRQICWYSMPGGQAFELPRSYRQAIDEGRWQLQIIPIRIETKTG